MDLQHHFRAFLLSEVQDNGPPATLLYLLHHHHGPNLAALSPAHEAEAFGSGGFDADGAGGYSAHGGEALAHGRHVAGDLGGLEGDGYVGVDKLPPARANLFYNARKEDLAVDAGKLGRSVGKQVANISQCKGAQEGVTQGVDGHVSVGMGYEAHGRVDFQPAEPHRESLAEGVDVVSLADSEHVKLYRRSQGRPWP